ncbi:hypothetical protein [Microbispora sp. CA-102843]|uniref:hypothetical protein n=1 Tax=Microbispora sp. CA-102843 TaxID=3239952 RepID=UPI003D934E1E
MPIPLPNLDDRSYADLMAQAQALIPALDPAWTNYNPSDPGITLIELLAWLTEMQLFQVNQVTPASTEKFLKLLNGPNWRKPPDVSLDAAIRQTILAQRERYRAVTADDYEWLALNAWPQTPEAGQLPGGGRLARARCIPRRDLSVTDPAKRRADAPAHVSLVVLPAADGASALYDALWQFFDERRTLTTRHHVVRPGYVPVEISANLALHPDAPPSQTLNDVKQALKDFYDPRTGGPGQAGWPFGRAVYASEASSVLERVPMVDYVEDVQVRVHGTPDEPDRVRTDAGGNRVAVVLHAGELVQLQATPLVAYDVRGRRYSER